MKNILTVSVVLVSVFVAPIASATPMDDALSLYKAGDYANALIIAKPLAEQGDNFAQSMLGTMHYKGEGIPQNYTEAKKWYVLSAVQGNPGSQWLLGFIYYKGQGVVQDYLKGHMWENLASGNSTGVYKEAYSKTLGELEKEMTPAQITEAQQLAIRCQNSGYKDCGEPKDATASSAVVTLQQAPPTASLNDAKAKCADLGFKAGTEKFGECVLKFVRRQNIWDSRGHNLRKHWPHLVG